MENDKDIHLKLRNLRLSRGLTVNKLADKMGEDHQKVGRVERGTRNITVDYLLKVSRALQTSVEAILSRENQTNEIEEKDSTLKEIIDFFEKNNDIFFRKMNKSDLITKIYELSQKFPQNYRSQFLDSIFRILS